MKFKLYSFILIFLNILCILSIKFKAQKFSSPKYLRVKSFLIVFISFLVFVERIYVSVMSISNQPGKVNISKFSLYFTYVFYFLINIMTLIWMLILVAKQKTIAKLFTIFLDFKNFCDEKKFKINYKKIKIKTLITFCLIILLSLPSVIVSINLSKFNLKEILKIISILFYRFCLWIFYLILIHVEFLIVNLNDILESQIFLNNNCENLLQNMMKLRILFNLINQAFGIVFSLNVLVEFLFVIFCVSRSI